MNGKRFTDDDGEFFPFTVLDDRAGEESSDEMYVMLDDGAPAKRLPPATFAEVRAKVDAASKLVADDEYEDAFGTLVEALDLLPEPMQQWNAAGWILVEMGECAFQLESWESAIDPLQDAMLCPGTLGNPGVHLRLGQVRYELGDMDDAGDELARAYMGGGREIFEGQDPKYLALVERILEPPDGMDRLP
jgi:tetratricopeptide (TPR) repeat protein